MPASTGGDRSQEDGGGARRGGDDPRKNGDAVAVHDIPVWEHGDGLLVYGDGRLVPPDEEGAGLARCIREVLDEPGALQSMGERAKAWAQRYDKPTVVQRLLEVYERAIMMSSAE